ncbi:MAG: TM2 domain-containing protein [Verrucomicrobiota bacterium]
MTDTPPPVTTPNSTAAPKSRTAYILLAVFLGAYGIHNFYAGDKKAGLIKVLVSLLTCFIGAIPMWIWAIVDAINVKKDVNGVDFN